MASEKSFDPDDGDGGDQDLSGFEDEQSKNVATISAEVVKHPPLA